MQCGRVVKSAMMAIYMIWVQTYFAPFCCVLRKDTLRAFPCLVILASSSKFQLYLYKIKKKQNKKFQAGSNILAYPKVGRGNCLS